MTNSEMAALCLQERADRQIASSWKALDVPPTEVDSAYSSSFLAEVAEYYDVEQLNCVARGPWRGA